MAQTKKYDAIIIGDGIGGLVTASLLAKRGAKTLLVETERPSLVFNSEGFKFNIGPSLFAGLERGGIYDLIFSELGLGLPLLKNEDKIFHRPASFMQVVLPVNRLTLSENFDELRYDFRREFPGDAEALDDILRISRKIYKTILPFLEPGRETKPIRFSDRIESGGKYFAYRRSTLKYGRQKAINFLRARTEKKEVIKFFDLLARLYCEKGIGEINSIAFFSMICMLEKKLIGFCRGGYSVLSKVLKDSFIKNNGVLPDGLKFVDLELEGQTITGIRTEEGEVMEGTDFLINIPNYEDQAGNEETLLSLFFATPSKYVPGAMHENVVFASDLSVDAGSENLLCITLNYDNNACGDVPEGMRAIRVCLMIDKDVYGQRGTEFFRELAEKGLTHIMPFSVGKLKYLGHYMVDSRGAGEDFFPGKNYQKVLKSVRVRKSSINEVFTSSFNNLQVVPEQFGLYLSRGTEARNGFGAANEIKSPRFSFIARGSK